MTTLDQLATIVDSFEQTAREHFARDGEVAPLSIVGATRKPDGTLSKGLALLQWSGCQCSKDEMRDRQRRAVDILAAEWICNISEAWAVSFTDEAPVDISSMPRPSKHPDRIEIIQLHAECPHGMISRVIEITRDADGKGSLGPARDHRGNAAETAQVAAVSTFTGYFTRPVAEA